MLNISREELLIEKYVTYTLLIDGNLFAIENVSAQVNEETGEQFFSPATVEGIQDIILSRQSPDHTVEVPVYNFAA